MDRWEAGDPHARAPVYSPRDSGQVERPGTAPPRPLSAASCRHQGGGGHRLTRDGVRLPSSCRVAGGSVHAAHGNQVWPRAERLQRGAALELHGPAGERAAGDAHGWPRREAWGARPQQGAADERGTPSHGRSGPRRGSRRRDDRRPFAASARGPNGARAAHASTRLRRGRSDAEPRILPLVLLGGLRHGSPPPPEQCGGRATEQRQAAHCGPRRACRCGDGDSAPPERGSDQRAVEGVRERKAAAPVGQAWLHKRATRGGHGLAVE
mmetsp:Transcript_22304/g.53332  ORF Transcript_22304/g.53332 Transcript_22304/m.53332 type:complete len:267 (-) Transcript_22304:660-1460(-)